MNRTMKYSLIGLTIIAVIGVKMAPTIADKDMNQVISHTPYKVSAEAQTLHDSLTVMDWHSDTLMWPRNILHPADYGHVDVPRMSEGNTAIQMFTTVTKVPKGQNYESNDMSGGDRLTPLIVTQLWPIGSWTSIYERAAYQAKKLQQVTDKSKGGLVFIKRKADLARVLSERAAGGKTTGALLGAEGAHPLEGKLDNIDRMYDMGFRMIGLMHFFDNELGGSLHGTSKAGLTDFGKAAVKRMQEKGIIVDLAHASEKSAWDTLDIYDGPLVVSHTGLNGACDSPRNVSDELMKAIAAKGGLIAIGYWQEVVCGTTPSHIAKAIKYGIDLVGADHIALGSDWDGAITAIITTDEMAALTDALMIENISTDDIRKVMGSNSIEFLQRHLPD